MKGLINKKFDDVNTLISQACNTWAKIRKSHSLVIYLQEIACNENQILIEIKNINTHIPAKLVLSN